MEHQVFVPVPADDLRAVLRDPSRVARCVPGLQRDADSGPEADSGPAVGSGPAAGSGEDARVAGGAAGSGGDAGPGAGGPVAGRLRLRVGPASVTYRGTLAVTERDPEHFTVRGEGAEVRGSGSATLAVGLSLTPHEGGTRLEFDVTATADGRAAAFDAEALATALRRLLDRLCANLAEAAGPWKPEESAPEEGGVPGAVAESVFDTEVPPPSLDPFLDEDFPDLPDFAGLPELDGTGEGAAAGAAAVPGDPTAPANPPAEAAHARRTMIGRSAEEVDHAPPRGRYAPVPAPSAGGGAPALRWIAPAAALALASAVVVGRALRRRR